METISSGSSSEGFGLGDTGPAALQCATYSEGSFVFEPLRSCSLKASGLQSYL